MNNAMPGRQQAPAVEELAAAFLQKESYRSFVAEGCSLRPAALRDNGSGCITGHEVRLRFVRVEPLVIPKKALTGENTERVDTRVLQAIYAIDRADHPIYVGQQLDVFIDSGTVIAATQAPR